MVKRRPCSYSILAKFALTIQDLGEDEPIPRLKKIKTKSELASFCSKLSGKVVVEKKIDGISCHLIYRKGRLIKANTKYGWNVMRIIRDMRSIPKRVDKSFTGSVRGELFISKQKFILFNKQRAEKKLRIYRSPIQAIMGLSKTNHNLYKDKIEFHGFLINTQTYFETQLDVMRKIKELGINKNIPNFHKSFNLPEDFNALYKYVKNSQERRDEFLVNIDGLVVKANELTSQRLERKVVAFKY
jgi:DNA ligase (NAD+)